MSKSLSYKKCVILNGGPGSLINIQDYIKPWLIHWFRGLSAQRRGNVIEDIMHEYLNGAPLYESASADGSYKTLPPMYMRLGRKHGRIYEIKGTNFKDTSSSCKFKPKNVAILATYNGDFVCCFVNLRTLLIEVFVLKASQVLGPDRRRYIVYDDSIYFDDTAGDFYNDTMSSRKRPRYSV
jgi:hypothetical protein